MKKFLHRPLNPWILTQKFGENKACVDIATGKKVITADGNNPPPGYRSLYGPKGHRGIDCRASHGQPVYCAAPGIVTMIDTQERSGLDVRVTTVIEGRTFRHIYEHLLGYQPKLKQEVRTGDLIGWADNTGYSSGNHLHFQLEELIDGAWIQIDPEPLMFDAFALQVSLVRRLEELVALLAEKTADWLRRPK